LVTRAQIDNPIDNLIDNRRKLRGSATRAQDYIPMSLSFAGAERSEVVVGRTPGRTPWSAADALVGLPGL
jgi:hypothetical protein